MWPLKLLVIVGLLSVLATVAHAQSPCSVKLHDGTTVPCVNPDAPDAGVADKLLAGFRQTGKTLNDSYNCFFYVQTDIERRIPFTAPWIGDPRGLEPHNLPGHDYIDPEFLMSQGYKLVSVKTTVEGGGFENGDIILVPGVPSGGVSAGEQYVHAGIVWGTRGGTITHIRQKHDPYSGVVDLTPQQFDNEYPPGNVGSYPGRYQVYHHSPLHGQITVRTGFVRRADGLYATAQRIGVTIYLMTPDSAYIGPQPIFPRGYFVAVDGIFHSSGADNFSFEFQDLYDAQGIAHSFDQTIPLHYECSGQSMSC